jgi:hypothetical protein
MPHACILSTGEPEDCELEARLGYMERECKKKIMWPIEKTISLKYRSSCSCNLTSERR